jgi:hypothetical protein
MSLSRNERREYYHHDNVQARIGEFIGPESHGERSAVFLAVGTEGNSRHREALPVEELPSWLQRGAELNRSHWDRQSLLCHLDVEYVNFDDPSYPFLHAERIFALQAPVIAAAEECLAQFDIQPLKVMTGRGYHLAWRVGQDSKAFAQLAELGHVSASLKHLYATERAPTGEHVPPVLAAAFAGLGLVMEWVAHQVKRRAPTLCEVPVELGAIETGCGPHGREMISMDITEYADPLCSRVMRIPFSIYLKPAQQHAAIGDDVAAGLPSIFIIPLDSLEVRAALRIRNDPEEVEELARTSSTAIPEASPGMERLIRAYRSATLARIHADFYAQEHDAPALWPETYDRAPLDMLAPCARVILEQPNDLLLRPGCVQRVVRVLLALGWHPRHIAGLIRSKYERDFGWGDQWRGIDPGTRADYYARVFTGLLAVGADDLVDFNCQSAREEGLCFASPCGDNLVRFRDSLLDRRKYERLASGPFNRLFLPTEHL